MNRRAPLDADAGHESTLSAQMTRAEVFPSGPSEDLLRDLKSVAARPVDSDAAIPSLPDRVLAALTAPGPHHDELVRSVCELAVDPDPDLSRRGQQILFSTIAETLGDSFDAHAVAVHDAVFSQVIDFCRRLPGASQLDTRLSRFGINTRGDCLARRATLTPARSLPAEARARVRKVFVLSRVTLGADVAVTSIVLQKIQRVFPGADRHLIGPPGVSRILSGLAGTRVVEQAYDRRGLLARLESWDEVAGILERETTGLDSAECVVIDPDSRITQLGLLPVVRATVPYMFFESRTYRAPGLETLGELTAHWLNGDLTPADNELTRPGVVLSSADVAHAGRIVQALRRRGISGVVALNLGVGGNARKRIPGEFELQLVRGMLAEGSAVVLDHGAGEDEARVLAIVNALRAEGRQVADVDGTRFGAATLPAGCDVVAYRGPVGPFAALCGAGGLYVGYDSAFQHIAAAQRVPVIDIFVNPPNPVFPQRWRPHSAATVMAIQTTADSSGSSRTLARVVDAYRQHARIDST